jgi:hypothetical protein
MKGSIQVLWPSHHLRWIQLPMALCFAVLTACSGDDASPVAPPPPPPPSSNGSITGRVIASDGSGGVPNAVIEVGAVQTTSGADGSYTLSVPAGDRTVVRAGANGFAENIRIARVVAGQSTSLTVRLVKVGVTQTMGVASGGTIAVPNSAAQVVIPANGLISQAGGSPAANVGVSVTPIAVATTTSDMPGDFSATSGGGIAQLQSFGAMLIDVRDSNNVRYGLAPGSTSTIRIPVSTRSANVPTTIPLFYFDDSTGRWVQDGEATLAGTGSDRYYQGTVSRLSYWNADLVTETIFVNGCVKTPAGQPAGNALVESDGIDYSGFSQVYAGSDGSFRLPIQKSGKATVTALVGTQLTNTVSAGPSATDIALDSCLVTTTSAGGFNIKLTWGASPSDLDSHLLTPNGNEVDFTDKGSLTALPFAKLDVDDVDSFGPEVVTISQLMQGKYQYLVHNFSSVPGNDVTGNPNIPGRITDSPARVELTRNGSTTLFAPTPGEGNNLYYWHVFDIVVDAQCNVTVTPVNAWLDQRPPLSPEGTPTFCNVN